MTRLARDCFAHGGDRISVAQALALLEARMTPVAGVETVPLATAAGRVLAETLISPRDVPAFDNAAVDGYAFAASPSSTAEGASLRLLAGRAAAGHPYRERVPPGSALQVLTGAMMPAGADTVALQEEVELTAGTVTVPAGLRAGANRRRAGEDVAAGRAVLEPGARLRPQEIGLAAELGRDRLEVRAPLRVAILSSGDELVEPGAVLREGSVFDANRYILHGLLRGLPVKPVDLGILPDEPLAVGSALERAAASHDVILASGGASRGAEDHVVRSVAERGRLDFWQIAMKPGRPLAFGRLGEAVFIGLPGNPVAAMVCFLLFARPVLLRLGGAGWSPPRAFTVPAGFALRKKPGRSEYLRATLRDDAERGLVAHRIEREGSGILTSMVEAQGLVELPPEVERVAEGQPVRFLSFPELGIPA